MEKKSIVLSEIVSKKSIYCLERPPSKRFVTALVLSLADIVDSVLRLVLDLKYFNTFSRIVDLHDKLELYLCDNSFGSIRENLRELTILVGCLNYTSLEHGIYIYTKCPALSKKTSKIRAMRLDNEIYLVKLGNILERLEITSTLRFKKYIPRGLLRKALEILKTHVETKGPLKAYAAEYLIASQMGLSRIEARELLSRIEKLRYLGMVSSYITSVRLSEEEIQV